MKFRTKYTFSAATCDAAVPLFIVADNNLLDAATSSVITVDDSMGASEVCSSLISVGG